MANQTVTILCGKCRVGIEGPAEPDAQTTYNCPSCGHSDTYENVMASVTAFAEVLMAEHFDKMLVGRRAPRHCHGHCQALPP